MPETPVAWIALVAVVSAAAGSIAGSIAGEVAGEAEFVVLRTASVATVLAVELESGAAHAVRATALSKPAAIRQ